MTRVSEVVVVGGGPAGAAAALELAALGREVVLLERDRGAPERFCGEFLSPDGVGSLDALGVLDAVLAAAEPAVLCEWRIRAGGAEIARPLPAPALGIARRELDPALRRAAESRGVDVREGCRVVAVEGDRVLVERRDENGAREREELEARAVIGAPGRARVPGLTAARAPAKAELVGFKAHFEGRAPDGVALHPLGDAYVGLAPVGRGRVNLCCLARARAVREAGDPSAFFAAAADRDPSWEQAWSGLVPVSRWLTVAGMSYRHAAPASAAGALAGDAAGLVAPLLGEGMSMALESGRLAARRVDATLDRRGEATPGYRRDWHASFRNRLSLGRLLQPVLLSRAGAELAVRALGSAPPLADGLVRHSREPTLAARGRRALAERELFVPDGGCRRHFE